MATSALTKENFEDTIKNNGIVLIDFWAEWCGPCRSFGPIFEEASERHGDVTFVKVNTEDERELAANFGVRSIPMLVAFRDEIPIFGQPGLLPGEALDSLIDQIKGLDMTEVKAEYEKQLAEQQGQA